MIRKICSSVVLIFVLLIGCGEQSDAPILTDQEPTISADDLAMALGLATVYIEVPDELRGESLYYEITWESGKTTWGGGVKVPEKGKFIKTFIHSGRRNVSYLVADESVTMRTATSLLNEEEYPYFGWSPGVVSYEDFRLVFAQSVNGMSRGLGSPPVFETDSEEAETYVIWKLVPAKNVPEEFSHTVKQRLAESTARSFRGARCEKTARRDLKGGSSETASPTLIEDKR